MIRRNPRAAALLPMALVIVVRLLGPEDLDSNDQAKQALYVLDICESGRWILPREQGNLPATKPPLYAWLASLASLAGGGPSELACRLVSAAAALGIAALVFSLAAGRWDERTGVGAAWAFASFHTTTKLSTHIRPDMVLTLLTTLSLLALSRLELGKPKAMRALFWLAASFSILAKGPPGPLVVGAALLGLAFLPRWRATIRGLLLSPWIFLLLLPALWFALALAEGGEQYWKGTVLRETVERALASGAREGKGQHPGTLLVHFLVRDAPWSWIALANATAALFRRDAQAPPSQASLPAFWLLGGLLVFSLFRGQREDYLLPLLPAASVLAAAPWFSRWGRPPDAAGRRPRAAIFFSVAALVLAGAVGYTLYLSPEARSGRGDDLDRFAERVNGERRPEDSVSFYGPLGNGVRFLTRLNKPSSTLEEVGRLPRPATGGRNLLICDADGEAELAMKAPERFVPLLRHPHGRGNPELVLLAEDRRGAGERRSR